jgi:hypothetical protein
MDKHKLIGATQGVINASFFDPFFVIILNLKLDKLKKITSMYCMMYLEFGMQIVSIFDTIYI